MAKSLRVKLSGGLPKEVWLHTNEDAMYFYPEWMEMTTSEDRLHINILPKEKTYLEVLGKIPRKSHIPTLVRDYEYWGEPSNATGYDETLILLLLHGY